MPFTGQPRPGDMIHVDTKQLARFERVGHCINRDRRLGCCHGAGFEKACPMPRLTMPPGLPKSRFSRMRSRQRRSGSSYAPWLGSTAKVSAAAALSLIEVDAFYWTALTPDIVNPGREEQGSASM